MKTRTIIVLFQPFSSSLKDFMTLLISYFECYQKVQPYTYTTQITVLYIINQGIIFLTTKILSNKKFQNFSYHRRAYSTLPYRILFIILTTSKFPPYSLLIYLVISIRHVPLLVYLPVRRYF